MPEGFAPLPPCYADIRVAEASMPGELPHPKHSDARELTPIGASQAKVRTSHHQPVEAGSMEDLVSARAGSSRYASCV